MKRVHAAPTLFEAVYIRSLLEGEGIDCVLRNEYLSGAAGELPPTECWPEVWVVADAEAARATEVIASARADAAPPWQCANCGEVNEGQFGVCWRCRASRP